MTNQASPLEDLRVQAWVALTDLARELATLDTTLQPTRRISDLRVINHLERQEIDAMIRKEKADIVEGLIKTGIRPTGHIVAPARMRSLDAVVQADTALIALQRLTVRHLRICLLPTGQPPTTRDRALRLRDWTPHITSTTLLARLDKDATSLFELAHRAIDGERTTKLDAPCPYCHRDSLVAYHEQGMIRCDKQPRANCLCGSETCGCTRGRRHVWYRDRGQWDILARMLNRGAS